MKFDLHIHSTYSDGHADVKEIIKAAKRRGLDGIALTDHDTMRGIPAARRYIKEQKLDLTLIPGVEVTTSEGHLLVLGVDKAPAKKLSPEETIEKAHDLGGIADVPHPYHPFRHAIGRIPDADAVEVYNSKHLFGLANGRAKFEAKKGGGEVDGGGERFALCRHRGAWSDGDRCRGCGRSAGGNTSRAEKDFRKEDTAEVLHRKNTVTYIYKAIVRNARRV